MADFINFLIFGGFDAIAKGTFFGLIFGILFFILQIIAVSLLAGYLFDKINFYNSTPETALAQVIEKILIPEHSNRIASPSSSGTTLFNSSFRSLPCSLKTIRWENRKLKNKQK